MSTWNYRVMKFIDSSGESWHEMREVYYTGDKPTSYSARAASVLSDDVDELIWILDRMREALDKPVLEESEFI